MLYSEKRKQSVKLAEDKALNKGAVIVADNVEVSKNEMLDYLEYVRSSGGIYKSETIETTLEFTPNLRDAIEVLRLLDESEPSSCFR